MKSAMKNYTTDIPVERTIAEIQPLLAHKDVWELIRRELLTPEKHNPQ